MTPQQFLDALKKQDLLPSAVLDKLRKKTETSSKPLTAKSLARFLIEKGLLTKHQALSLLAEGGELEGKPAPQPAPSDPSGINLPLDDLQDLSSSAEWSVDEGGGGFAEAVEAESTSTSKGSKSKKPAKKGGSEWDSPLLLIGGGALVLLVLIGVTITLIMTAEDADNVLMEARSAMQGGNYPTSLENFEKFVTKFPGHPEYSKARVELATTRIRQSLTAGPAVAFETAQTELKAVENEADFNVAEEHLSDLLPQIARALAERAEKGESPEQSQEFFTLAESALGMAYNTKYIPKARRDVTELERIRETIERVQRRQQSLVDLESTLSTIDAAVASGDTNAAYTAQEELVEKHPSLIGNERLASALANISQSEQANIRYIAEPIEASRTPTENAIKATLGVAKVRLAGEAPAEGYHCVQVSGVAYGVNLKNGEVIWRHYVGPTLEQVDPQSVGDDLLLVEWRSAGESQEQSLVRINAATGEMQWRLTVDDTFAQPVVSNDRVYLAGKSGRLHVVDASTGTREGYLQFAQPLSAPPAVHGEKDLLYVAGEHSSIYSISTGDNACVGVFYSKHPRKSIVAAPAVVLDKLAVVVNDGVNTCRLHLLGIDGQGVVSKATSEKRLTGRVVRQPLVGGRRLVVVTDRGQISVYEVSMGHEGEPISELATRRAGTASPFVRFAALSERDIWFGENSLAKYAVAPAGNRLTVQELAEDYNRSQFVAPIEVQDNVIVHVRSRKDDAGFTVTACSAANGKPYWETDIAIPPGGEPVSSDTTATLLLGDANGHVHRFSTDAMATQVLNISGASGGQKMPLSKSEFSTLLQENQVVFTSTGSKQAMLHSLLKEPNSVTLTLPDQLACRPAAFGQGWLAPLSLGQVLYLDSETASPLAAPFQPPLRPGESTHWIPPAAVDDQQFVIADRYNTVYLVELRDTGVPALIAVAEGEVGPSPLRTNLVVVGDTVLAGTADGHLARYQIPHLERSESISVGSPIVWGPYRAGDVVVAATANGELAAFGKDGEKLWQVPLSVDNLAGAPITQGGNCIVASDGGVILTIELETGTIHGRANIGEPVASGPISFASQVLVAGRDGALLVVDTSQVGTE